MAAVMRIEIDEAGEISVWAIAKGGEAGWQRLNPAKDLQEVIGHPLQKSDFIAINQYNPCKVVWIGGYPYVKCW